MAADQDVDGPDTGLGVPGTDGAEPGPPLGLDSSGSANDTGIDVAGVGGTPPGSAGASGGEGSLPPSTATPTDNLLASGSTAGPAAKDASAFGSAPTYEGVEVRTFAIPVRTAAKDHSGSLLLESSRFGVRTSV